MLSNKKGAQLGTMSNKLSEQENRLRGTINLFDRAVERTRTKPEQSQKDREMIGWLGLVSFILKHHVLDMDFNRSLNELGE